VPVCSEIGTEVIAWRASQRGPGQNWKRNGTPILRLRVSPRKCLKSLGLDSNVLEYSKDVVRTRRNEPWETHTSIALSKKSGLRDSRTQPLNSIPLRWI